MNFLSLLYQDALAADPGFDDARIALASTYLSMSDTGLIAPVEAAARMRSALAPVLQRSPVPPLAAAFGAYGDLLASNYQADAGQRAAIGDRLRAALDRAPDNPKLLALTGNYVGRFLGDDARAMQLLERALELDPLNPELMTSYGLRLLAEERYDDALSLYARLRQVNPGHSFGWLGPGRVAELRGELAEAVLWTSRAMQADRRDHENPAVAAELLLRMGLVEEATPWIRHAELLNATGDDTRRVGMVHAYLSGDHARAFEIAETVVRARNQNRRGVYHTAVYIYTLVMDQRGELDAAIEVLEGVAPGMTAPELPHPPRDAFDLAVFLNASSFLALREDADMRRRRAATAASAIAAIFPQFEADDGWRGYQARLAGDYEAARAPFVAELRDVTQRGWTWALRLEHDPLLQQFVDHPEVQQALEEVARQNAVQAERYRAYVAAGEITVP